MRLLKRILCWLSGHKCGPEFLSLYTSYRMVHQRCERCGLTTMKNGGA